MNTKDILIAMSTFPDADTATRVARTLVEESLAACVNVIPGVRSIYRWSGAVQDDRETLAILKTTAERFDAMRDRLLSLHPYETPELVAIPVADGHHAYLSWVAAATRTRDT